MVVSRSTKEYVLTEQVFVKDPDMTISEYVPFPRRLTTRLRLSLRTFCFGEEVNFYCLILSRLSS